jgi:hypothetical protein
MADLLFPADKGEQQQGALKSCTKKYNFCIHFWPRVTQVTLLKYVNGNNLAWIFKL